MGLFFDGTKFRPATAFENGAPTNTSSRSAASYASTTPWDATWRTCTINAPLTSRPQGPTGHRLRQPLIGLQQHHRPKHVSGGWPAPLPAFGWHLVASSADVVGGPGRYHRQHTQRRRTCTFLLDGVARSRSVDRARWSNGLECDHHPPSQSTAVMNSGTSNADASTGNATDAAVRQRKVHLARRNIAQSWQRRATGECADGARKPTTAAALQR